MRLKKILTDTDYAERGSEFVEALLHTSVAVLILVISQASIEILAVMFGISSSELFSSLGILQEPIQFALNLGLSLVLILAYLRTTDRMSFIHTKKPSVSTLSFAIGGLAILLLSNAILSQLFSILGISIGTNTAVDSAVENSAYYLYMITVMIFFVGPVEELIFRGISQGSFREYFSVHTSVIVTSVLFGLIHFPSIESQSPVEIGSYVLITVVLGIVLGYVYEKTEDILVPILMHGIYNSVLLLFLYFREEIGIMSFV
jgi:hypothetical protein